MDKITSAALTAIPGVTHGFYTRNGAPPGLVTVHQVHSALAVVVDQPWSDQSQPRADALVTNRPGLLLAVKTADCAPVLLADTQAGVVAAAHAGWRGALDGVLEDTVDKMTQLGAKTDRIIAAIGPCIGPHSYEVSHGFEAPFIAKDAANARFFQPASKPGHALFDLPGYVAARLASCGVKTVDSLGCDTLTNEATFFSHRRASLRHTEKQEGRQMSVIGIQPTREGNV